MKMLQPSPWRLESPVGLENPGICSKVPGKRVKIYENIRENDGLHNTFIRPYFFGVLGGALLVIS